MMTAGPQLLTITLSMIWLAASLACSVMVLATAGGGQLHILWNLAVNQNVKGVKGHGI